MNYLNSTIRSSYKNPKCFKFFSTNSPISFDKILIANRGEIACRIARTCRRLGIKTVSLYSDCDGEEALHARCADEFHRIGTGPSAAESYLRGDYILDIASQTKSQAIHPGYGFLSENATFAQSVSDADFTFIGPPPRAIQAMGSKSESKSIMDAAGVPTVPGYYGENQDAELLLHEAVTQVGFPLLIKAVMGGGGKGMRVVWNEQEFFSALESCKRESLAAFGDSSILLEKYLIHPRHIEVQILADQYGNTVHLYERDCSLQRRHQKVIEEAPASDLDPVVRKKLGDYGVKAAKAVNYVNAGTVEFLLDTQSPEGNLYFCEMNTRLQVEHPITELVTNLDLVEWQLRIASGEELMPQDEINCSGHAFEARIYAENPLKNFLPATGIVKYHKTPSDTRVDTGIQSGQSISVHYDPMISKLIVHGENRTKALQKLVAGLKGYKLVGVPTNIDFLVKCAQHPTFSIPGECNTGFLDNHLEGILDQNNEEKSSLIYAISAVSNMLHMEHRSGVVDLCSMRQTTNDPWSTWSGSWRAGGRAKRYLHVKDKDVEIVSSSNVDGSYDISIQRLGESYEADSFHISGTLDADNSLSLIINNSWRVKYSSFLTKEADGTATLHLWSNNSSDNEYYTRVSFEDPSLVNSDDVPGYHTSEIIAAPMPGKISCINAQVGDNVKCGDIIVIMEAMKMEHSIQAPCSGTVKKIVFDETDIVSDGDVLVHFEASADNSVRE